VFGYTDVMVSGPVTYVLVFSPVTHGGIVSTAAMVSGPVTYIQ